MDLKGRSFLTLLDFNKEEIRYMLDLAHELKAKKKKGILGEELKGKNIVLVFYKSSTRTRCSFEVAATEVLWCSCMEWPYRCRPPYTGFSRLPDNGRAY